jgi:hypothetical protein
MRSLRVRFLSEGARTGATHQQIREPISLALERITGSTDDELCLQRAPQRRGLAMRPA